MTATAMLIVGMNCTPEIAGVGRYTGDLAAELASRGHDVKMITTPPHYPGWRVQSPYRNRYSSETVAGVKTYRCPLVLREKMRGMWRLLAPLSFSISSAPLIFWRILRDRPDVVLCIEPTLFSAPAVLAASRMAGSRTVLHVQDLEVDAAFAVGHLASLRWAKRLAAGFERACLKSFGAIVTISNRMADKLIEKGVARDKIVIVRNWVDLDHIKPTGPNPAYRQELGLGPHDFIALYSGNIGPKQGLDIVAKAARALKDQPNIIFVIAGEGPVKPELIANCRDLPNVRFLPFQPYARLSDFLGLADLHLMPQSADAADLVLPSKLGGILASGRPVLVTADEGTELAEFLEQMAMIIPPGDHAALADTLRRVSVTTAGMATAEERRALAQILSRSEAITLFEEVLAANTRERIPPHSVLDVAL